MNYLIHVLILKFILFLNLLSSEGLPPFIGFLLKLLVIQLLIIVKSIHPNNNNNSNNIFITQFCLFTATLLSFHMKQTNSSSYSFQFMLHSCNVCLLVEQVSDCLHTDSARFVTYSLIKCLQVARGIKIPSFSEVNCKVVPVY